jgi:hypothetical protein
MVEERAAAEGFVKCLYFEPLRSESVWAGFVISIRLCRKPVHKPISQAVEHGEIAIIGNLVGKHVDGAEDIWAKICGLLILPPAIADALLSGLQAHEIGPPQATPNSTAGG